jgi:hypothetical protein
MAASFPPTLARLLACAALTLALLPATASAASAASVPVPAAESLMNTAHALAVTRWGVDACGGQVTATWIHMGPGINARSQWMSTDARDPSSYSSCAVTYNLDVSWDWPKLCTVVEHELGHLTGHDHVDDPHDVMSAYYVYPAPECTPVAAQVPAGAPAAAPHKARPASSSRRATASKAADKRKAAATRKAAAKRRAKLKINARRGAGRRRSGLSPTRPQSSHRRWAPSMACAAPLPRAGGGLVGCVLVPAR